MLRRLLLIVPVLVILALAGGFVWLGAFPPKPHVESVDHAVPVDRFAPAPAAPVLPPVQAPQPGPASAAAPANPSH